MQVLATALVTAALSTAAMPGQAPDPGRPGPTQPAVHAVHDRSHVPGLAGTWVRPRGIDVGTAGRLKAGSAARLRHRHFLHLGSLSKAITATAVAQVVRRTPLRWTSTVGQVFPQVRPDMPRAVRRITLARLLRHRSGLPAFTAGSEVQQAPSFTGPPARQQGRFTRWLLRRSPEFAPGTFHYSNAGYTVAAQMASQASGRTWRQLVRRHVARPLGVDVRFGMPARSPDQPWGHVWSEQRAVPVRPTIRLLPAYLAPAGDLAMQPRGYGRFVQAHVRGLDGHTTPVGPPRTIRLLHRPRGRYAMGWLVRRGTDGHLMSLHDGTVGTFYGLTVIDRARGRAAVGMTNIGGPVGARTASRAVDRLLRVN